MANTCHGLIHHRDKARLSNNMIGHKSFKTTAILHHIRFSGTCSVIHWTNQPKWTHELILIIDHWLFSSFHLTFSFWDSFLLEEELLRIVSIDVLSKLAILRSRIKEWCIKALHLRFSFGIEWLRTLILERPEEWINRLTLIFLKRQSTSLLLRN